MPKFKSFIQSIFN